MTSNESRNARRFVDLEDDGLPKLPTGWAEQAWVIVGLIVLMAFIVAVLMGAFTYSPVIR